MRTSDPSLVPEWLRCNGHGNSGGNVAHHSASANSHSDAPLLANSSRNRSSKNVTDINNTRPILDRSSSINSRGYSSNNGSSKHPYSNFSRSHRDKEHEKERSAYGDIWDRDSLESLGKQPLMRSHSMVSRKQGDLLPRTVASDSKKMDIIYHHHRNGLSTGDKPASAVSKVSLEEGFPSLGSDVVRVVSPGLTIPVQGLPVCSSALIGEEWSVLAEVPVNIGSNSNAQSCHQPLVTSAGSSTNSGALNTVSGPPDTSFSVSNTHGDIKAIGSLVTSSSLGSSSGMNMAEALIQPPSVTGTAPQLSVETQRLEQLAIKKVKQLIPVTPTTPKVLSSSDKLKLKLNAKFAEISGTNKVGTQPSSSSLSLVGHSPRGGSLISDASKQSHGSKLYVLKPPWENCATSNVKDGSNLENNAFGRQTNNLPATSIVSYTPTKSPNSSKASVMERKAVISYLTMSSSVEKRPLSPYAKSRSDFFNSVRKKTPMTTTVISDSSNSIQSPSEDESCVVLKDMTCGTLHGIENGCLNSKDGSIYKDHKPITGEKNSTLCAEKIPDEEEAFLRSLGWEESCEEEEGLTEEEINAFYQEVIKLRPSLNLSQGAPPALSLLMESHASNVGGDFKSDAPLKSN